MSPDLSGGALPAPLQQDAARCQLPTGDPQTLGVRGGDQSRWAEDMVGRKKKGRVGLEH